MGQEGCGTATKTDRHIKSRLPRSHPLLCTPRFLVALHVHENGWTRSLLMWMFSAAWAMQVPCLLLSSPWRRCSIDHEPNPNPTHTKVVGVVPTFYLFIQGSVEMLQMASTWIRLHIGGGELLVFAICASFIEGCELTQTPAFSEMRDGWCSVD